MNPSIFMIGWEFPPHYSGGLGVACQGLTRGLIHNGVPVYFTLPKTFAGGASSPYRIESFYHTPTEPMEMILVNSTLPNPYWKPTTPDDEDPTQWNAPPAVTQSFFEEVVRYGSVVASVAPKYTEAKIIHAHDWMSIPAGIQTRQKVGKPLVLHIHSTEFDRSGGGAPNQQIAEIEWQGLNAADHIVTVSEYTKGILQEKYGISAEKIDVVHNGIDPQPEYHSQEFPQFLQGRHVVAFVGRLTIQKGPEYFLAVAKAVIEKDPKAIFVLAGDGDMYQSLLVSAAAQGLSGSVLFAGFLRGKERAQVYDRANVFVMPSVSEPFGISALEAALARTPVIVSKTAGVTEVLPHAIAVDFWDVYKMRDAILEVLAHPRQAQQFGKKMQSTAQEQTWEKSAQSLSAVYRKLLN